MQTKAFNRVNHSKLFTILIDRKVPTYLVRLLYFWYSEQLVCVKWGEETSKYFKCTNGVYQGGTLSPLLFNVYFDHVSSKLNDIHVGCLLGSRILNHLLYADDLVLVSPSATGLQKLINCCVHYGHLLDIRFNEAKTKTMHVYSSSDKKCKVPFPDMLMNASYIEQVSCYKYLGCYITSELNDDKDILRQISSNYAKGNMLLRNFRLCSTEVKKTLFKSYLCNMYCSTLWSSYTKRCYSKLTSYNNAFRFLLDYPMYCSASQMFVENSVKSFKEINRVLILGISNRIYTSENALLNAYVNCTVSKRSKLLKLWNKSIYV